ncbi:MAG: leucine-rich repeat domain-containing protein [Holosporales bacterium]|nr:leucine-rich repeat domain-containing protein [Holosporales bacterium]
MRKILRAGKVHFRDNGTNTGEARVVPVRKKHPLIKLAAHLVCVIAIIPQSHASLDSPLARIGAAQQCIASNSLIIKTVNTPLYPQLVNNFDCIYDHLEQAMQEIIEWRDELYSRHPELPLAYPEFDAFLIKTGNTIAGLSAQSLTRVLINVGDASNVETNVEHLYIVKNYTPFNIANYVNLKTIAMFDGTMTDALRTAIQNLAKQQKKLERIIIPSWGPTIEEVAFDGCSSLKSCNFGTLTSIGLCAFRSATSLVDFFLLKNITFIGHHCFLGCWKLCTVGETLNELYLNITNMEDAVFESTALVKVTLPKMTYLPGYVFQTCHALLSVDCPLVTSIRINAFNSCESLKSCNFGTLTTIGNGAFSGCTSLSPIPSVG